MKRLWKYVRRVEKHLPLAKRIPVGGAIYAALRKQAKQREEELGRKLSDDEIDAIAKAYGEPELVAARHLASEVAVRPIVERYLAAIGRNLPQDKAHDILAEMREAIESRIEGREAETDRTLSEAEISGILKEFGPPMVAASRYATHNRLIGPELYPFFWPTAKAVLGVVAGVAVLIAFVRAISSGDWVRFPAIAINGFTEFFLPAFAVMMLVFIFLDRSQAGAKIAARWNPKSLPQDHIRKPRPLFESVLGLGFDLLFILWWTKTVDFSGLGGEAASVALNWGGAWSRYYTAILVLASCSAVAHAYDIVHPGWSRVRAVLGITAHAVGAYVAAQLARQSPLVIEGPGAADIPDRAASLLEMVNRNLQIVLILIAVFMVLAAIVECWRLVRSLSEGLHAAPGNA